MQTRLPMESSLLLVIHEAEAAVRRYRILHDLAAQVGVPAHITVAYPFKPTGAMGEADLARLGKVIAATPAINIERASTRCRPSGPTTMRRERPVTSATISVPRWPMI